MQIRTSALNLRSAKPEERELANAIADARNYDIVLDKLSKIMTAENIVAVTTKFTEEGIIKGAENVWK